MKPKYDTNFSIEFRKKYEHFSKIQFEHPVLSVCVLPKWTHNNQNIRVRLIFIILLLPLLGALMVQKQGPIKIDLLTSGSNTRPTQTFGCRAEHFTIYKPNISPGSSSSSSAGLLELFRVFSVQSEYIKNSTTIKIKR